MRLSLIFLWVLAASVLVTSLAAWGITYGTSYSRVTTMSTQFTAVAHGVLDDFGKFVTEVLQTNAGLLNSVLQQQRESGEARTQQATTAMVQVISTLVNYSTNATVQSQREMNGVVDTFSGLMGNVVGQFRNVTTLHATQLRASLAEKVSSTFMGLAVPRITSLQRYWTMQDFGVLNLGRSPYDPISQDNCLMLDVVCIASQEIGKADNQTFTLSSGRTYLCTNSLAWISVRSRNGSTYNEDLVMWRAYNSSVPASAQKRMMRRCMLEPPDVVLRVGVGCSLNQTCQCGYDLRCAPGYQTHNNDTSASLIAGRFFQEPSGDMTSVSSISLFNASSSTLAAVASTILPFSGVDDLLRNLGQSPTSIVMVVFNDTEHTVVASLARCAANETIPGDPRLNPASIFRACNPGVQWVAQFLAKNGPSIQSWVVAEHDGVAWDFFPVVLPGGVQYFVIISNLLSEIYGAVDAVNAMATAQLSTVRGQQLSQVAANGQATLAYTAAVGADSVATSRVMGTNFLAQLQSLDNSSRSALAASQQSSEAHGLSLTAQQTTQIDALKAKSLDAMSTTAGWTIGVVVAILLLVLFFSAWGTVKVTLSLLNIIGLMEAVADMKVEDLEVPQSSSVTEVARIQTAFQVLITRLAEYKSYIPAGLFDAEAQGGGAGEAGRAADESGDSDECPSVVCPPGVVPRGSMSPTQTDQVGVRCRASCSSSQIGRPVHRRSTHKNVAVMVVNAMEFIELLGNTNDGLSSNVFNDYVSLVHEAVAQHRGNIDCIVGDKIVVTFNAHLPCSDSCGAAVTSALDIRSRMLKMGGKLKLQIGISFGTVFAGSVGYTKFKSMVTVGSPMKIASVLSRMPVFDSGTILIDSAVEERTKFAFKLSPVELVHIAHLKSFVRIPKSQSVFMVFGNKDLQVDEWMYQIEDGKESVSDWLEVFARIVSGPSAQEREYTLNQFLESHPHDKVALRLRDRMPLWVHGLGIPQ
eukprot:EG_transcript_1182